MGNGGDRRTWPIIDRSSCCASWPRIFCSKRLNLSTGNEARFNIEDGMLTAWGEISNKWIRMDGCRLKATGFKLLLLLALVLVYIHIHADAAAAAGNIHMQVDYSIILIFYALSFRI